MIKKRTYSIKQWIGCFFSAFVLAAVGTQSAMAMTNPSDIHAADGVFRVFLGDVSTVINGVLSSTTAAGQFVESLFLFFVIARLAWVLAQWMFKQADNVDVIYTILLIMLVQAGMTFYDGLTTAVHSWGSDFASVVQQEMIGTADIFYAPAYLNDLIHSMKVKEADIWDPITSWVGLMILSLMSMILSILAFFVVAWATWGFALAKLIGWMLIPFLLLPQTQGWFRKWLGFFMGFVFYEVIGRINLAMVLMLMTSFFNLPLSSKPARVIEINGEALSDFTGLFAMILIGIVSLLSTGKFASAFASVVDGFESGSGGIRKVAAAIAGKI